MSRAQGVQPSTPSAGVWLFHGRFRRDEAAQRTHEGHLGQGQGGIQERTYTPNRSQVPSMLSLNERQVLNATRTSWPCPILSITDDNLRGYAQRLAQLRLTNGFLWLRYLIKLVAQLRYGLWRIRSPQPAAAAGEDKCDLHIREPAGLEEMEVFQTGQGHVP
jgi:hypothetical protein